MPAVCVAPIKARTIRLTAEDECGVPITGVGSSQVTTNGFVSVEAAPEYEDGTEYIQKNANGELCVNEKDPSELKRVTLTSQFCLLDPDAFAIIAGERLLTAGGVGVTGTGVAYGEGILTSRFSLELWQPISGVGACTPGGVQRYLYWAFMNVGNANIGSFTFQNDVFTFEIAAETKRAFPGWNVGAAYLDGNVILEGDHFLHIVTTVPPPTPACGAVAYTP
jgi:hypothetical protein